jgi:hypothetical protein
MASILAAFRVLILFVQAFLDAQVAYFETLLLREHVKTKTEVKERLD